jgi:hypothetical protein
MTDSIFKVSKNISEILPLHNQIKQGTRISQDKHICHTHCTITLLLLKTYNWASLWKVSSNTIHNYISSMCHTCWAQPCCDRNYTVQANHHSLSLSLPLPSPLFFQKPLYYNFRKHVAGTKFPSLKNKFYLIANNSSISMAILISEQNI